MTTVLCFGDSNTHGTTPLTAWGERGRLPYGARWTTILARALPDVEVIAEGLPGRTTVHDDPVEGDHKNGLRALPILLETHCPIDLVILMLGTNDLKPRFSVGPADIARSVDRLLLGVLQSEAGPEGRAPDILLVSPAPIREAGLLAEIFAGGAGKSQRLGAVLRDVAEARNAGFLDAGGVAESSHTDGIHLTEAAHVALAAALIPLVRDRLGV